MRKKMIALTLAVLLICSVAIPASAATGSLSRIVDNYALESNDTCNYFDFSCTLTYGNPSVQIRTDVDPYYGVGDNVVRGTRFKGNSSRMAASHRRSVDQQLSSINCLYYVGGSHITTLAVLAGY